MGVTVSYSAQVGPDFAQSTYSASLESSYNQSWESTNTLSYSEDESTTNTSTVGISYTSTITPTPTTSTEDDDEALSIDVYNQKYTIEAGDDVVIDTTFAKGIYNADLKAPYFLSGPVGTYTFGTITTNDGDGKLYTEAWQGGGQPKEISSNIGKAAKWATLYDWQSAFDLDDEDVEITQWEDDEDLAYVDNASTVTTGAGAYFVINTYVTKGMQDGGSNNISLRKSDKKEKNDSNISYSDKVINRFKEIGIKKLPYTFNIGGVNDLGAELEKTAERLKLSEDAKKTLPGYYIKQKMEGDSVIILPDRVNHLDISKSKGKTLILAESGRGRIATGSANDIIATNKGSLKTIRTGSGADIVYSLGNGDNINVGDGKDSVYALGENAFIKLGNGKNESVFLGDKTTVQLFNFKPGSTRLGASSLAKNGERIDNFKANNFKLRETESGDTFRIKDRSGNQRGNIELHHSQHANKSSMARLCT